MRLYYLFIFAILWTSCRTSQHLSENQDITQVLKVETINGMTYVICRNGTFQPIDTPGHVLQACDSSRVSQNIKSISINSDQPDSSTYKVICMRTLRSKNVNASAIINGEVCINENLAPCQNHEFDFFEYDNQLQDAYLELDSLKIKHQNTLDSSSLPLSKTHSVCLEFVNNFGIIKQITNNLIESLYKEFLCKREIIGNEQQAYVNFIKDSEVRMKLLINSNQVLNKICDLPLDDFKKLP